MPLQGRVALPAAHAQQDFAYERHVMPVLGIDRDLRRRAERYLVTGNIAGIAEKASCRGSPALTDTSLLRGVGFLAVEVASRRPSCCSRSAFESVVERFGDVLARRRDAGQPLDDCAGGLAG